MTTKIKVLTIGDHPLIPSGVGCQEKYLFEGLLDTGRYVIRSLGAAVKHQEYNPVKFDKYGEDWIILPIDGYGNPDILRQILDAEKPDALWIMTDPRFYMWLFEMSDEIAERGIPLLYNTIWDNYPVPDFNKPYYECCDFLGCISKLTYDVMVKLDLGHKAQYIPHAIDSNVFKKLPENQRMQIREKYLGPNNKNKFVIYYNSRNARRKMTADVVESFKFFLDKVGHDKAFLFMHTDPNDQEGSNLNAVAMMLGLTPEQIRFAPAPEPPEVIAQWNNMSDVLVNISNNEGFGLSCLEALSCGTLAIVNRTGGLQDQIKSDDGTIFGVSIEPVSKSIQGSQQIPYIYDDRVSNHQVCDALTKIYHMPRHEREALGTKAREWTLKAFSMKKLIKDWDQAFQFYVDEFKNQTPALKVSSL